MPARRKTTEEWVAHYTEEAKAVVHGVDAAFKQHMLGVTMFPKLQTMGAAVGNERYLQATTAGCREPTINDSIIACIIKSVNKSGRSLSTADAL